MTILTERRQPVLFLPHGGGPCFFMQWPHPHEHAWDKMAAFLRSVAATLPRRPEAIVVISGHWETAAVRVTTNPTPSLLFDYYGFPPDTYKLSYPAPGAPALAEEILSSLRGQGWQAEGDSDRGFDHGVFIPFLLAFPDADIPVIEISLPKDADAQTSLHLGEALAPLRERNILIIGTGMTYHNLRHFMRSSPEADAASRRFDAWLAEAVTRDPADRAIALAEWHKAPNALDAHPEPEHLLPLMVASGAAKTERGKQVYSDTVMGKALAGYRFD